MTSGIAPERERLLAALAELGRHIPAMTTEQARAATELVASVTPFVMRLAEGTKGAD